MRTEPHSLFALLALLAVSTFNEQIGIARAQGTAFTYEGQLQDNGSPASGTYNLAFTLFDTNSGGSAVAGPVTSKGVIVSNGLFTVLVDFSGGAFTGQPSWLQIGVETNGAAAFSTLAPRQQLTPTPYAIFASTAGNVSGTVSNRQLANSSITVLAGPGLSGGGTVALGGSITLTNIGGGGGGGLVSVTGNSDITATTVSGVVTLGDTATNGNTAGTLVKRDSSGNFSAGTITLSGNLALPGIGGTPDIIYSGTNLLLYGDGSGNLFSGQYAGNLTVSGGYNTANGNAALASVTSGNFNTASGYKALFLDTSGSNNTANGAGALENNTTGGHNTANGVGALQDNLVGSFNTASGWNALFFNTIGTYNTAIGEEALGLNTNGALNTAIGSQALVSNTSGSVNTANGYRALFSNEVGYENTAVGAYALENSTNDNQLVAIGYQALQNDNAFANGQTSSGNGANTAVGFQALQLNTIGNGNTAVGYQALNANTTGGGNTATGDHALLKNTSGSQNTANGVGALYWNTSGWYNTANGIDALYANTEGGTNTANGFDALSSNTNGSANTANGAGALENLTTGSHNTADGNLALSNLTEGDNNIALGNEAGIDLATGSDNIYIGNPGASAENGIIRIGNEGVQTNAFIAGIYTGITAGGSAVYVDANGQLGTRTSSRRYKQDIRSMGDASDVLLSLRPVTFRYKPEIDPKGLPQFGLVAEEVDQVDPDLVVRDQRHGIYTVRYETVNAMLLNEFQKEHNQVEQLKRQNDSLVERLNKLEAAVKSLAEGR